MSTLGNIQEIVERSVEKRFYDLLLEHGYIADRTTYAASQSDFDAAMSVIEQGPNGFAVGLFGHGPSNDRGEQKMPRVVITGQGFYEGTVGNDPTPAYVANGLTFDKVSSSSTSSTYRFKVSLVSNKTSQDRLLEQIRVLALPNRIYVPYYNDANESFLVTYTFLAQNPDLSLGIFQKEYYYEAIDVFEIVNQVVASNIPKMTDINIVEDKDDQANTSIINVTSP